MHQNLRAVNLRCMVFQVECTLPHNSNNSHNRLTQTNSLLFSTGWVEFLPKECLWEWGLPISQDSCNNNNRQVYRRVILSLKCCVMERVCNCDHSSEAATQFLYMYVVRIFLSWHSCSVSCYQWVNAAMTKDKVYKEIILYSIEGSCKNLDSFCCVSPSELLYICAQLLKWPSKLLFGDIPVHVFIPVLHLMFFVWLNLTIVDVQIAQIQQQMQQMRLKQQMPQQVNMHSTSPSLFGPAQTPMANGWMPQQPMSFPQQQHPQFVTTGPVPGNMGFGNFPMGAVPGSGQTLSHQLWK